MKTSKNEFEPNYAVSPGETLVETLEELKMSYQDLALKSGLAVEVIEEVAAAETEITPEIAAGLEKALSVSAAYWLRMEKGYQEALVRLNLPTKQKV